MPRLNSRDSEIRALLAKAEAARKVARRRAREAEPNQAARRKLATSLRSAISAVGGANAKLADSIAAKATGGYGSAAFYIEERRVAVEAAYAHARAVQESLIALDESNGSKRTIPSLPPRLDEGAVIAAAQAEREQFMAQFRTQRHHPEVDAAATLSFAGEPT